MAEQPLPEPGREQQTNFILGAGFLVGCALPGPLWSLAASVLFSWVMLASASREESSLRATCVPPYVLFYGPWASERPASAQPHLELCWSQMLGHGTVPALGVSKSRPHLLLLFTKALALACAPHPAGALEVGVGSRTPLNGTGVSSRVQPKRSMGGRVMEGQETSAWGRGREVGGGQKKRRQMHR